MSTLPEIGENFFGMWWCQSTFCGVGWTRDEAIDNWVQDVKNTAHPGGFNERSAKIVAKKLREIPA